MANISKKVISMLLVVGILFSFGVTAFAAEADNSTVITADSEYYLTADEIMNGEHFSEEEIEAATTNGAIILGGFDAPLSALSGASTRAITGNVWCRTYATYDTDDGVSVNVELYVPWYFFTNPKFTSMSGTVTVTLNSKNTYKGFAAVANEEKTIDADADTGAKAASGTKGRVTITGIATGTNILAGAGKFDSGFDITIP